jgi:hypothetical protein
MRIFMVGDTEDLTHTYVSWLAQRRGWEVFELPEIALGLKWSFAFDDSCPQDGALNLENETIPFSSVSGVFVRLHHRPGLPDGLQLTDEERGLFLSERRIGLSYFLNTFPAPVVNRPTAGRSNASKPFQMRQLAAAGFRVPSWIATNNPRIAKEFAGRCPNGAIYKACSGLRSQVRILDDAVLERLAQGSSPVVVQEYIPGRDVRVHVVANDCFATEVLSSGVDYRFQNEANEYRSASLPEALASRSVRITRDEGLGVSGIDFRVTEDGTWYCLEVNPVPSFLPYEMATAQPIGNAILDMFIR